MESSQSTSHLLTRFSGLFTTINIKKYVLITINFN
jgi:hypothetical protein